MKYIVPAVLIVLIAGVIVWSRNAAPTGELPSTASSAETASEDTAEHTAENGSEQITSSKQLTTKNGMKIEIIKEGTGEAITNGQIALVQYEGMLTDGTVFDSTAKHGGTPFQFPLGAGMVIAGWEQGVLGMKVGETRKLTIPPELGYGAQGAGGIIPPNATLIFTVTLEGVK